jgi:hypothetical protein
MGYRSEIGAVISVDDWTSEPETDDERDKVLNEYKKMIGLIKLSKFYELMQNTEEDRKCIGWWGGEFYFKASQWKWYPDYDIVQAWNELWEQMQEVEGISGLFNRVGEETDDIEEDNFGDDVDFDMFYCRSMLCFEAGNILGQRNTDERVTLCMDNNATQA